MRVRYIDALEHEAWIDLPGRTYARAFLRSYAAVLGLDADRFVAEFDDQWPEPVEPVEPARRRRREVRIGRAPIVLVSVVVVLGIVGWTEWPQGGDVPPLAGVPSAHAARKPVTHTHVAAKRPSRPELLVVRAVGGACWVLARRGGATGPVLLERTLEPGQSVSFSAGRVWLRLGAPWNVTVRRGSHALRGLPAGQPADVTL